MKTVYKVEIIESERGWGQKVEDIYYFSTEQKAKDYIKDYNKDLPRGPAPDWYMIALGPYKVSVPEDKEIK